MNKPLEIGVSKYKNIGGVTCYMNSILVILQQIPVFTDYIVTGKFESYLDSDLENKIIYQLHRLFKVSLTHENLNLTPSSLRKTCKNKDFIWGEYQQQDSAEFFQFLITNMEEELGKKVEFIPGKVVNKLQSIENSFDAIQAINDFQKFIKKEFSPLKKFFTGLDETKTICQICNNKNNNYQTFVMLQLPIPINNYKPTEEFTLYQCFDKWFEIEKLDDLNRSTCDFCNIKSNANKNHCIWSPPKILVIQLKRFKKDMYGNICRKITNNVDFPVYDLDISKYISDSSPHKNKCKYSLIGVNIHHELGWRENINMGHYVSAVKNRYDNNWYLFNDECKPLLIFKEEFIKNPNSYLLFYYRTN